MSSIRYLAMWGKLPISSHPRLRYDTPNKKGTSAMADKRKWEKEQRKLGHPERVARIEER